MAQDILLLCVDYKNDEETEAFVRAVFAADTASRVFVSVADNSEKSEADWISFATKFCNFGERIIVSACGGNLGYFGGLNFAYQKGLEKFKNQNFLCVVVSNTDIELIGQHFFDRLTEAVSDCEYSNVGVIAPSIRSSITGADQNPFYPYKPSRKKFTLLGKIYSVYTFAVAHRLLANVKKVIHNATHAESKLKRDIYGAHGSFMVFLKRYFGSGLGFNYPEFLFCEEMFVAEQCKQAGLRTVYLPEIEVIHREHSSTGLIPSREIVEYLRRSHEFCRDNYF
ncbi:GT2 family glycosyltransferase [Paraburkholderia sp. BL6669N2]|uniref:glycosyltransferase family 2 protein n=1 Tax=Paraburkholderia sp. BL6669N2 TaxID=1938807 RepID=UPI000E27DF84|nr:glycosyltransferase [Paraburkholderia sp. BL6669N2]REG45618.1 GT2 family glycosyltransferase [Paraburkholderia sp. BL6669N2]